MVLECVKCRNVGQITITLRFMELGFFQTTIRDLHPHPTPPPAAPQGLDAILCLPGSTKPQRVPEMKMSQVELVILEAGDWRWDL